MKPDTEIYQQILHPVPARYLNVRPQGIELSSEQAPLPSLTVRILHDRPARTLYRSRHPICRSLDGLKAIDRPERRCALCPDLNVCTPQVQLLLLSGQVPYRLLLAYTSAKNFLLYQSKMEEKGRQISEIWTLIRVVNRGNWGELKFSAHLKNVG